MADNTHISWRRWQNFRVYCLCTLVSAVLTGFGCCWSFTDLGPPPATGLRTSEYYLWLFLFPMMTARQTNVILTGVLFVLNPLIYGGIWWFAWRMWRLMRRKPESDGWADARRFAPQL